MIRLTKAEVNFFIKRLEVNEMRFTLSQKVIVRDPVKEVYLTMAIEDVKNLMIGWYFEGRRHSKAMAERSPRLVSKLVEEFCRIAFLAVSQYDQEDLIRHEVSDEIMEVETL